MHHKGRASGRCGFSDQGTSTSDGWKFRRVGRHVLNVRLRCEGMAAEGRCMECYHFWIYDRWMFSGTKYVALLLFGHCVLTNNVPRRSSICVRFSRCVWYPAWCVRGRRRSFEPRVQRRQSTATSSTYVLHTQCCLSRADKCISVPENFAPAPVSTSH